MWHHTVLCMAWPDRVTFGHQWHLGSIVCWGTLNINLSCVFCWGGDVCLCAHVAHAHPLPSHLKQLQHRVWQNGVKHLIQRNRYCTKQPVDWRRAWLWWCAATSNGHTHIDQATSHAPNGRKNGSHRFRVMCHSVQTATQHRKRWTELNAALVSSSLTPGQRSEVRCCGTLPIEMSWI